MNILPSKSRFKNFQQIIKEKKKKLDLEYNNVKP